MIYILEFSKPLGSHKHSARYYIGYCKDEALLASRLKAHNAGRGAKITRAARDQGITFRVAATMQGDRSVERLLKNMKNTPRIIKYLERNWLWLPKSLR